MTSKQLLQLLKEHWKSYLRWLGVFALLLFVFLLLGYAPIYGNARLMFSRVLIVARPWAARLRSSQRGGRQGGNCKGP